MSGECKSYRLNDPMTWKEFMSMPDDIKVAYIKLLRQKFNAPGKYISQMLGINNRYYSKEINRLGISEGKNCRGRCTPWDKEGFWHWANGMDKIPTPVLEEEPVEEPVQEEPEAFVEEDIPWDEPDDPIPMVEFKPYTATPCNGSVSFKNCPADQALNTLKQLLGDANVSISITWKVEEGDGDNG